MKTETLPQLVKVIKAFVANAITYHRIDQEIGANWRYKLKQSALMEPRRQAFKVADSSAATLAEILSEMPDRDFLANQAGNLYLIWEQTNNLRSEYFAAKNETTRLAFRESEKRLKAQTDAVSEILRKQF